MTEREANAVLEAETADVPKESKYNIGRTIIPDNDNQGETLYTFGSDVQQQSPCFGYTGQVARRHLIDHAVYDPPPAGTAVTPAHVTLTSWSNIFIAGEQALDRMDLEEAEKMFLLARDWTQQESSDTRAVCTHFTDLRLAHIARKKGNAQEAEKMYREIMEALGAARAELANERFRHFRTHIALDVILHELALICWKQHRYEESLHFLAKRVERYQGRSGEFDYSLAAMEVELANCLFYQKKISEAEKLFRHAGALVSKLPDQCNGDLSRIQFNLARCNCARQQNFDPLRTDEPVENLTARAPWMEIIERIDKCQSGLFTTQVLLSVGPDRIGKFAVQIEKANGSQVVVDERCPAEMPPASDTHYYKQLMETARDDLDSGIFSSAPRVLNEAFALGLLSECLSKEATADDIATVILSSVHWALALKPEAVAVANADGRTCRPFGAKQERNLQDVVGKDESMKILLADKRAQLTPGMLPDGLMSEAAALISTMPEKDKENLAASLISILQLPGGYGNDNAVNMLVLLGPPAVPAIVHLLTGRYNHPGSNNPKLLAALHKIGDQFAIPEMMRAMEQLDSQNAPRLERVILDWLGGCGASAIPQIVPYLGVFESCGALEKIGPVAIPAILEEVQRSEVNASIDWNNRRQVNRGMITHNAARVLSKYGAASAQPVLDAIKSTNGTPRQALLAMLGHMQSPAVSIDAAPAICRAFLEDENYFHASQALRCLGTSAISHLCDCFAHADRSLYPRMLTFLSCYGYSEIPLLTNGLSHFNPAAQANCAVAILKITGAEDDKAIKTLLSLIGSDADDAMVVVLEALINGSENGLQLHLVPALVESLRDAEPSIRRRAEKATGEISSRITVAIDRLMEFIALSSVEDGSEVDVRFLIKAFGNYHEGWGRDALKEIDSIIERVSQLNDATKKTVKVAEPLMRRAANQAPEEVRGRITSAIDRLMQAVPLSQSAQAPQSAAREPELPLMPTYSFIREVLERQFPNGMVVSRCGYPFKNEKGEMEVRVEEKRAPVEFTAQQLTQRVGGHNTGQPTLFKKHIMVSITAGQEFRTTGHFGGGHRGLYVYDGERLTHIDGADARKNIGEVFRVEALKLDEVDPVELCSFFCRTLVVGCIGQHTVVEPSEGQEPGSVVTKPSVTVSENGWKAHFWTLKQRILGCVRDGSPVIPELCEHTVTISPQFDITYEES